MKGFCSKCRQPEQEVHKNRETGDLVCENCDGKKRYRDKSLYEKCSRCGRKRPVKKRLKGGRPLCCICVNEDHYYDKSRHEICSKCGKKRPVKKRTKEGKSICPSCANQSHIGLCADCNDGTPKPILAFGLCATHCQKRRRTWERAEKVKETSECTQTPSS